MLLLIFSIALSYGSVAVSFWDEEVSVADIQCLQSKGIDYFIIKAFNWEDVQTVGTITIQNAQQVGIKYIDILVIPDPKQVPDPLVVFKSVTDNYPASKFVWIDPYYFMYYREGPIVSYLSKLVKAFESSNRSVGLSTSSYYWRQAFGNFTVYQNYSLVYEGTDENSFDDFVPFGGWVKPAMKLKRASSSLCGHTLIPYFY